MEINWIEGAGNFGVEMICPGVHITQSQWRSEWNEPFQPSRNDNISDYECAFPFPIPQNFQQQEVWGTLQQAKVIGTSIPIVHLAHVTNVQSAAGISERIGFTGKLKIINENVKGRFSWWNAKFDKEDVKSVRNHLADVIRPFIGNGDQLKVLRNQFATSRAFTIQERYGGVYFTYTIEKLCGFYAKMMGIDVGQLRFKVLGTYLYKQEIMHAVCVCGDADAQGMFNKYPDVPTPEDGVHGGDEDDGDEDDGDEDDGSGDDGDEDDGDDGDEDDGDEDDGDYGDGDGDACVHAVVTRDANGNWKWKPQATATEIDRFHRYWQKFPMYRRWEQMAFAFYLPTKDHLLAVDNIEDHCFSVQ
jgi:hypothetical protein